MPMYLIKVGVRAKSTLVWKIKLCRFCGSPFLIFEDVREKNNVVKRKLKLKLLIKLLICESKLLAHQF